MSRTIRNVVVAGWPSRAVSRFRRSTSRPLGPSGTKQSIERTDHDTVLGIGTHRPCGLPGHSVPATVARPSWDDYFLGIATAVAARADCTRRKVGAVVVQDHRIISTGYNGSPPGGPSCLAGGCPRANSGVEPGSSYDCGPGTCIAVHAEANAIIYAGRDGCDGSTLYLTCRPCEGCSRLVEAAGISRVVWP